MSLRTSAASSRALRRDLVFASPLMLAMFAGSLPQFALGVLAPVLTGELGIDEAELGFLASGMYVSAAMVARLAGRGIDRMGGRRALVAIFGTATGVLVLMAASQSWLGLVAAVVLAGVGIGANNPATNRLIAVHLPDGRRGIVIGVKQIGVKLAHVAAGAAIPPLALAIGWRESLLLLGAATTFLAIVALKAIPRDEPTKGRTSLTQIPTHRELQGKVRWLRYYATFMGVGMSAITTYLPLHTVQKVGLSLVQGGLVVTVFGATAVVSRLVWAAIAERRRRPAEVLALMGLGGSLSLIAIAAAPAGGAWLLWSGAVIGGVTAGSWNVVAHLTIVSEIDSARAAAATGLLQANFMVGLASGAPLFGAIVTATRSFQTAWLVVGIVSGAAFVTAWRERSRRLEDDQVSPNAQPV